MAESRIDAKFFGKYTHAIVCRVPDSFSQAIGAEHQIDVRQARIEHSEYVKQLRNAGIDVIELPADENFPDCVFVEDTAVICNGQALICKPGHPSRAKEVNVIRSVLKRELNLPIIEIRDKDARIDGGDVLFTGEEFFVGISNRTNYEGASALAKAFPEYGTVPIHLPTKILHLKSVVSMVEPGVLCFADIPAAENVFNRIESEGTGNYKYIKVPDQEAANALYINGRTLYRNEFPISRTAFESRIFESDLIPVTAYHLTRPQGTLTSLSLLINKER